MVEAAGSAGDEDLRARSRSRAGNVQALVGGLPQCREEELLPALVAAAEWAQAMSVPIIWIAGPIQFWEGDYKAFGMAWDFVGEDRAQHLNRWRLMYSPVKRTFFYKQITSDEGDQAHLSAIRKLYASVAVMRSDLPKGNLTDTLKAMLPAAEIAFATRLTIQRRYG